MKGEEEWLLFAPCEELPPKKDILVWMACQGFDLSVVGGLEFAIGGVQSVGDFAAIGR